MPLLYCLRKCNNSKTNLFQNVKGRKLDLSTRVMECQ